MNPIKIQQFDLEKTLFSGQIFNFRKIDGSCYGVTTNNVIKFTNKDELQYDQLIVDEQAIKRFLRLDEDLEEIFSKIKKDEHVIKAIDQNKGLRILKQDFDVCLISFILSQRKNIKAIRKCIDNLCINLGEKVVFDSKEFYLFPTLEKLANSDIEVLIKSGLGYRAKYVKESAKKVIEADLDKRIHQMPLNKAKEALLSLPGVGIKVADCILVYSLGFNNITPLDIWGYRVAWDLYGFDKKAKYSDIQKFFDDYFNGYASYAALYLFEYMRRR